MRSDVQPAKLIVYNHLRQQILSEQIDEPRFITEEILAARLEVSRTPVREAFLMLQAEGFLQLVPRKGALVLPITGREVRDVMEVRSVVESWCAARVMGDDGRSSLLVEALRARHEEFVAIGDDDSTALIEADRAFHRELVSAAGNQVMLDLYERLRDRQIRMGVRAVLGNPARAAAVRGEHQRIIDALAEGGEADVLEAVRAHLSNTAAILRERVRT